MKTITAPVGKWLTQIGDVPDEERIMVKQVSGFGNIADLYREATPEEVAEYQARQQEEPEQLTTTQQ